MIQKNCGVLRDKKYNSHCNEECKKFVTFYTFFLSALAFSLVVTGKADSTKCLETF